MTCTEKSLPDHNPIILWLPSSLDTRLGQQSVSRFYMSFLSYWNLSNQLVFGPEMSSQMLLNRCCFFQSVRGNSPRARLKESQIESGVSITRADSFQSAISDLPRSPSSQMGHVSDPNGEFLHPLCDVQKSCIKWVAMWVNNSAL